MSGSADDMTNRTQIGHWIDLRIPWDIASWNSPRTDRREKPKQRFGRLLMWVELA